MEDTADAGSFFLAKQKAAPFYSRCGFSPAFHVRLLASSSVIR